MFGYLIHDELLYEIITKTTAIFISDVSAATAAFPRTDFRCPRDVAMESKKLLWAWLSSAYQLEEELQEGRIYRYTRSAKKQSHSEQNKSAIT